MAKWMNKSIIRLIVVADLALLSLSVLVMAIETDPID